MNEIKPIETVYNGYRFRSRLEARWAVLFDAARIIYEYEPEGFELPDGTKYLPDFYLPTYDWYVEIKPPRDGAKEDIERASKFIGDKMKVLLLLGNIPNKRGIDFYHYSVMYYNPLYKDICVERVALIPTSATEQEPYVMMSFTSMLEIDRHNSSLQAALHNIDNTLTAKEDQEFTKSIYYGISGRTDWPMSYSMALQDDQEAVKFMQSVYDEARQARFEHGECG